MSGRVLAFQKTPGREAQENNDRGALLCAVRELHALITIDPILGASPARTYFVIDPQAKSRIAMALGAADAAPAYALIAYNFPFALHQFEATASHIPPERAKAIISCSAALQSHSLQRAAAALGVDAHSALGFDADALTRAFFPNTQETVTDVLRISLGRS